MKSTLRFSLIAALLAASLVLTSCGGSSPETPEADVEPQTSVVVSDPLLVNSLADVKSAVIQIEAQGTFVDPEFGEYSGAGLGSGFIIDSSGLAITNNHVVTGAALLSVWVGGDTTKTYNAQILAVSECSDLALIDIEGDGFPYLTWYKDPIKVGLEVYAAGFPLGDPEFTLTKGIISKENAGGESTWSSVDQVLEHDATINPGNSGGPLVTEDGQVVGVNYASYAEAGQFFAIGRDATLPVIEQFKAGDDVDSLGINGMAVMSDDGTLSGIWVSSVKSGSSADQAGVHPGDLITSLESLPLAEDGSMATYCDIIRTQGDENTLSMEVLRFQTNELLEGQFNGRALSVSGSLSDVEPVQDTNPMKDDDGGAVIYSGLDSPNIVEVLDDGFMAVTDDTESLYMEVPTSWNQIDGSSWSDYWGDLYFDAVDVTAAPDLEGYYSSYGYPGVSFSASADWGNIGGYIMLLDGVKHWFEDACDYGWREKYEDPIYEGAYDYWDCGRDADLYVVGVRPISDPTAYLVLVTVQVTSDEDFEALDRIMNTFDLYLQ
ncbi:MAG: S1C family serine protease [Anaerolineales bacterium]